MGMLEMAAGLMIGCILVAAVAAMIHKLYEYGVEKGIVKQKYSDEEEN